MSNIPAHAVAQAQDFLKNEKEFRLGYLPTEQSHPRTANFSKVIRRNTQRGVQLLLSVDRDIAAAAPAVFASARFKSLVAALREALISGKRICFSGCGATGRLSILLEGCWRKGIGDLRAKHPDLKRHWDVLEDQVCSIMTGGDYALIRSVEFFEDYIAFGRRQVDEAGLGKNDVLVAVSEGGETSSVIGTVHRALERGASAFFVFNNPAKSLAARLERSRKVIQNPKVTVLELVSGPMAIAGSTRMQATTFELLVLGAALEMALAGALETMPCFQRPGDGKFTYGNFPPEADPPSAVAEAMAGKSVDKVITKRRDPSASLRAGGARRPPSMMSRWAASSARGSCGLWPPDSIAGASQAYADNFARLLRDLSSSESTRAMADMIELEEKVYRRHGLVTYFSDEYLLDIFTDTTERSPTFMLPPFRKHADPRAPESWAFVMNPRFPTRTTWQKALHRAPRCLDWSKGLYRRMGAPAAIYADPPHLAVKDLFKFRIGNEKNPARYRRKPNAAVLIAAGDEIMPVPRKPAQLLDSFKLISMPFDNKIILAIGGAENGPNFPYKINQNIGILTERRAELGQRIRRPSAAADGPGAPPARNTACSAVGRRTAVAEGLMYIRCALPSSPLRLWHHLAVKLVMNTVSTGTMGRLGRVEGNWMTHVHPTNKKLIDRGTRLIAGLTGLPYPKACAVLFASIEAVKKLPPAEQVLTSPVIYALNLIIL